MALTPENVLVPKELFDFAEAVDKYNPYIPHMMWALLTGSGEILPERSYRRLLCQSEIEQFVDSWKLQPEVDYLTERFGEKTSVVELRIIEEPQPDDVIVRTSPVRDLGVLLAAIDDKRVALSVRQTGTQHPDDVYKNSTKEPMTIQSITFFVNPKDPDGGLCIESASGVIAYQNNLLTSEQSELFQWAVEVMFAHTLHNHVVSMLRFPMILKPGQENYNLEAYREHHFID
jgi:hypothetical protein